MKKITVIVFASLLAGLLVFAVGCKGKNSAGPGSGKPAEITVEIFDRGTDGGKSDPTNNNWTKWIQEKILKDENIKVTFVSVSRWDENTALNNLMAAGNPPDVCLSYSGELIGNYRDLGGLFDMGPYLDTTLRDLKVFLGPDKALPGRDFIRRNQDTATGKVFSLPARRMNTARLNLFMRKDWLDKLGLPLPTTPQEFYDALVAFKEKDPGNVGKDKVIPFSMTNDIRWTAGIILESFIDPDISARDYWVTTAADRYFLLPGYKEGFRFLNRMYHAGLIDRDFPLYKSDDDFFNQVKAGFVGALGHNWDHIYRESPGALADLVKNVPGAELVPVDCMVSSDGLTRKIAYDAAGVNYFIPASCKDTDAAMRYINWLARYENYNFLQIGPEGTTHDVIDGIPKIKSTSGLWIQNSAQNIDYTIHINGLDLNDPDLTARALANAYSWPADMIANAYNIAMTNAAPGPVVPVALTAGGAVTQTLVEKGVTLMASSVTCAPANFDKTYDDALKDWLASGAQLVINEKAEKYFEP
ncbi:MAG: extracellular solute-binding protein [Treponema sp.]|nr:extracellular solute-binding protein [Treponema sp.]